MKKILFLLTLSIFPLIGYTQIEVNTHVLDENNVGITLSDGGVLASKPEVTMYGEPTLNMTVPGCEYPKGSGKHVMNGMSMWFGAVDEFDEPRTSAPTRLAYEDQFIGPLSNGHLYTYENNFPSFYSISREEIDYHVTNYQNPNYVMPQSIARWPAHGDVSYDMDYYLAPFVDLDGDGNYNPYLGEYPCIQGDRAIYMIMNDTRGSYSCGAPRNLEGMGIEIHLMLYQYSSIPELANTTFCKSRVINRSSTNYKDFSTSVLMNAMIGSSEDDFFATDIERNMIFAYNGDEVDSEYGLQPPAVGIVSLNKEINRSRVFGDYSNYGYHFPSFPPEFWQVMQGNLLTGENYPKRFGYPGDAVLGEGDVQSVPEQAYSILYTIDIGDFVSGEEREFDFAIVVGQGQSNLGSIKHLQESADFVQDFYSQGADECFQGTVGIPAAINPPEEPEGAIEASIYPNPSSGEFTLEVQEEWIGGDMTVFTPSGVVLNSIKNISDFENGIHIHNGPGVYLVTIEKNGVSKIIKAVVE